MQNRYVLEPGMRLFIVLMRDLCRLNKIMESKMNYEKQAVHDFWNKESCGEIYFSELEKDQYAELNRKEYEHQAKIRYELEPYILDFADFQNYKQKKVLEIGVGLGADHQKFAEVGAELTGVDLTPRAINYTRKRLEICGLQSNVEVADAENLPFDNESFELVYSWGVLHHSPDTKKCISEVFRVLKTGGKAKVMIYHTYSFNGYFLWVRYGLLKGKPRTSLAEIYDKHQESPGTKAYSIKEARDMFKQFENVEIKTVLTHGDLFTARRMTNGHPILYRVLKVLWPRRIIKTFFKSHGFFMLIEATK